MRIARSVSASAAISPCSIPRERVVAAPITRNEDWPARVPIPSPSARADRSGSTFRIRQAIFDVPMSRTAITPLASAAFRIARIARWVS